MKRMIIGITFLFCGIIQTTGILFTAAICIPPSAVWFLLAAIMNNNVNGADGLGLGIFFVAGIAMTLFGLVVLLYEFFAKNNGKRGKE